jgi:hypothetical protein
MTSKRNHVTIFSDVVRFPSLCSKCLGKTDLTSFKSQWNVRYMRSGTERVTRTAEIEIPICRSCKKTLIETMRKENINKDIKMLIIGFPIALGLYFVFLQFGVMNWFLRLFQVLSIGGLIALAVFFFPLLYLLMCLKFLIDDYRLPHDTGVFKKELYLGKLWPVRLEKHYFVETKEGSALTQGNTFSFENQTYAELFAAANPSSASAIGVDPIDEYIEKLKNGNSSVRYEAAKALRMTKDPKAVEPLIQALNDESYSVRQMVAMALGRIGDTRAVEALNRATGDKSYFVRDAAKTALKRIRKAHQENRKKK